MIDFMNLQPQRKGEIFSRGSAREIDLHCELWQVLDSDAVKQSVLICSCIIFTVAVWFIAVEKYLSGRCNIQWIFDQNIRKYYGHSLIVSLKVFSVAV